MKEIQSIPLTSMNNGAHFTFVSNMAERAEKDKAVSEKCAVQVKALREAVMVEDENLQISAKSLVTDKIAAADRLRDQLYAGYKKAVGGYVNFPVESLAEAAKVLQQHIKDYKIDVQAQLDKETINDLLYIRHYSKECRDIRSRLFALKSGCAGY